MAIDLSSLNEKQREAVEYNEGPLVVLSSAGSGKTRVLTTKIAYLLEEKSVRPTRVFAVTFTNKAAKEMQERLEKMIGPKADSVRMSTIHSLAYKIYKEGKKRVEPWFEAPKPMINEGRVLSSIYKYCRENQLQFKDAKFYLEEIAKLKMNLITPKQYKKNLEYETPHIDWDNKRYLGFNEALYLIYVEYEQWKAKRNMLDFNDMLVYCHQMLHDPKYADYVSSLQSRVEYLLIDECQDTNIISFSILKLIANQHRKITLVGDLKQSIYSFQYARIENVREFISEYNPHIINLSVNYRSTKTIVDNANKLISFSPEVIGEAATTPNEVGRPIDLISNDSNISEGEAIYDLIHSMHVNDKVPWKDITVLYRVHSQSRELEDWFLMQDVPYISYAKTTFYRRKEIVDLLAYLKLALDPYEAKIEDIKRIANRPTRYITNKSLDKIDDYADDTGVSPYEILKSVWDQNFYGNEAETLNALANDIDRLRKFSKERTTAEIFTYILENLGYKKWAIEDKKGKDDPDNDLELNFESLVSSVEKFPSPVGFIDFVNDMEKKEQLKKDENGDFVKLMSIHASKGKEFKNVIILGVCDRLYPFHMAVNEGNFEEERRVMYVAITRPEKKLFVSEIKDRYGTFKVKRSPFIEQMDIKKENIRDTSHYMSIREI